MKIKDTQIDTLVDFKKVKEKKTGPTPQEELAMVKEESNRLFKETFSDSVTAVSYIAIVLDAQGSATFVTSACPENLIVPYIGALEVVKATLLGSLGLNASLDSGDEYE